MPTINWILGGLPICVIALICCCRLNVSEPEIDEAFQQLATKWPLDQLYAERQLMDIKNPYEMLNVAYDRPGLSSENSDYFKQESDNCYGEQFDFDPDIVFYQQLSVPSDYFEQTIIPKSKTKLYIIMFYTNWCMDCKELVGAFKNLIDTFEPLGVQFATINAEKEPSVLQKTGADKIPQMVLVLGGKSYVYRQNIYIPEKLDEFIRKKIPSKIGQRIDDDNVNDFLNGWFDNRVRALILDSREMTGLKYLIAAFGFQDRVAFGFVDLSNKKSTKMIADRFNVDSKLDTLLLFNEDSKRAMASVSMAEIPTEIHDTVISLNQYLSLPRLSSQEVFEGVCPKQSVGVVLITKNTPNYDIARGALRHIALESEYSLKRARFAYIDKEKQVDFLNAISKGSPEHNLLHLVVIWRRNSTKIKYEWIDGVKLNLNTADFPNSSAINTAKDEINSTVQKLLKTFDAFTHEASVQNLCDENAPGLLSERIADLSYQLNCLIDGMNDELLLLALSLLLTTASMFVLGYVWKCFPNFLQADEETLEGRSSERVFTKLDRHEPELQLFELRTFTYDMLIRSLNPGCLTILMISDLESQAKLLPPFHRTAWPHRNNKNLLFAHLRIDRGLSWFSELLRLSLGVTQKFPINPTKCAGTVLAINGSQKYFCIFRAQHYESTQGTRRMVKLISQLLNRNDDPEIGNNSESNDELTESDLLDDLGHWLNRLLWGTTYKYHIDAWPDFPTQ